MDDKTRELVAVGSSLAAGCASCVEQHVAKARKLGATVDELAEVIAISRAAKLKAVMTMDELAEHQLNAVNTEEIPVLPSGSSSCGCGSNDCC